MPTEDFNISELQIFSECRRNRVNPPQTPSKLRRGGRFQLAEHSPVVLSANSRELALSADVPPQEGLGSPVRAVRLGGVA